MADIKFRCSNCGQKLEVFEEMAGQSIECPICRHQITIPTPSESAPRMPTQIASPVAQGAKAGVSEVANFSSRISQMLGKLVVGQQDAIDHVITVMLCNGHALLTGGAATAKSILIRGLSRAAELEFKRIQFTPDLMPSDITGSEILQEDASGKRVTRFVRGPIFTNLLMADEINRTPPKTQAALLEGMQERQVTAGRETMPLPKPFFVFATKTSIESDGTYPLPEAQQDRFMFNIELHTISEDQEVRVVLDEPGAHVDEIQPVVNKERLLDYHTIVRDVAVPQDVQTFIVNLTTTTRPGTPEAIEPVNKYVAWGAGVRASQYLALGAKARAAMSGRDQVSIEDVKAVVVPVMRHRIGVNFRAENDGVKPDAIIKMVCETVKN